MKKIIEKEFKSYYRKNAMFFNGDTIFTYPNQASPLINFKDGLGCFAGQIQEVFLFQNTLFVEVAEPEHANLIRYSAKTFLRGRIYCRIFRWRNVSIYAAKIKKTWWPKNGISA